MIGNPYPLKQNAGKSFQGNIILGKGFILRFEEVQLLITKDKRNAEVLFPYLSGDDLNNDPEQKPSRWVINFFDWSEEKARTYPDCFEIIERLVKPERQEYDENKNSWNKSVKKNWWLFGSWRKNLDETISKLDHVMVVPLVSKYTCFDFSTSNVVFMHKLGVVASNNFELFGTLSSTIHHVWAWKNSSTLGAGTLNYSSTDCFDTFPFPENNLNVKLMNVAKRYYLYRKGLMQELKLGLTKLYNQLHNEKLTELIKVDPFTMKDKELEKEYGKESVNLLKHLAKTANYTSTDLILEKIVEFRKICVELDQAVLSAYGWDDINLKHDFYQIDYLPDNDRIRLSIHPDSRKEILRRLALLNYERYRTESLDTSIIPGKNNKKRTEVSKDLFSF